MDHSFTPSQPDSTKCARCHYGEIDHGPTATCEYCGNTGICTIFAKDLICMDCQEKEIQAIKEHQSPEKQQARIDAHNAKIAQDKIDRSRAQDSSVQIKTDLFNAETVAITELFMAIDMNPNIENKQFVKASELKNRLTHFQKVIFDKRTELESATNSAHAIQTQLNELALKLRAEERDKLKLSDLSYSPTKPKSVKSNKTLAGATKKASRAEILEASQKYGVPYPYVQMLSVAKNLTAEQAGKLAAEQMGVKK